MMKKVVLTLLAVAVLVPLGAILFAWSGVYNIAADRGHFPFARRFLEFGMRKSIEFHASGLKAPPLNQASLIERGLGHFQAGCAPCHGAPGVPPSPVAQQMLPEPPDLSKAVPNWSSEQLFWIVNHGLKYTGMPAWPARVRDDEVWAVVAFLRQLPGMEPDAYRRLAFARNLAAAPVPLTARVGFTEGDPIACDRCHGVQGQGGEHGGIPKLAGQKPGYLTMTLQDYRLGSRPSGIMHPIAVYLSDDEIAQLSEHYASLGNPGSGSPDGPATVGSRIAPDAAVAERGRAIVMSGIPARKVQPCSSCHGANGRAEQKNPRYPALAGQHFDYLVYQLKLWRAGVRGGTYENLMYAAASGLTDEEIRALASYYSSLPTR